MGPFEVLPGHTRKCLRAVRFGSVGRVWPVPVEPKVRRGPSVFFSLLVLFFQRCTHRFEVMTYIVYRECLDASRF